MNAFQHVTAVGGLMAMAKIVFGALQIALLAIIVNQEDFWKRKEKEQELTSKHAWQLQADQKCLFLCVLIY